MENVQVETVVTLELNISEANLILGALRELPHRVSDDLIKKVISQAQKAVIPPQQ